MFELGKETRKNQTEKCAQLAKVRGVNAEISVDPSVITNQSNELDTTPLEPKDSQADNDFCKNLEQTIIESINDVCATRMLDLMHSDDETNDLMTHVITVKPDAEPVKQKTCGVPYSFKENFRKTLMEMKAGMIVDSKSPWRSPVRLVKKPDGSVRICVDYRRLNNVTIKDSYPIPKIEEIFAHLSNAKIFSTIDLCSSYYQIRLSKDSQQYTAFSCEYGFFEYRVLTQGVTNGCSTFQRIMTKYLEGRIGFRCFVYLDDVICWSENDENHINDVKAIIDRLRQFKLKIKLSKCKFARRKIEYLVLESHNYKRNIVSKPRKSCCSITIQPTLSSLSMRMTSILCYFYIYT